VQSLTRCSPICAVYHPHQADVPTITTTTGTIIINALIRSTMRVTTPGPLRCLAHRQHALHEQQPLVLVYTRSTAYCCSCSSWRICVCSYLLLLLLLQVRG
jgi:hypothetical protein